MFVLPTVALDARIRSLSLAVDAYLPTRLDFGWRGLEDARGTGETSIGMYSIEHDMDPILCRKS